ncbi:MAG TPA: glycoside hydrolase family 47 protein [Chitinophagaceae bacterium]|nr:glycoside hydrolase family 47 protein [Chitinophagaceae bacterium]
MHRIPALFCLLVTGLLLTQYSCHRPGRPPRETNMDTIVDRQAMAAEVKAAFLHAWAGYVKYAWGHDELMPLSRKPHDWNSHSLLMTPVDGFDTMILMGLRRQADSAKKLILDSLDFNQDFFVSNFETTIRELGGLLSAFEWDGDSGFLRKAVDLAARLAPAFRSPTGMPYRFVNLRTGATRDAESNPAEVGTMLLEYGTLTRLTGDPAYYRRAKKALMALYRRKSSKTGLVGSGINVRTGHWTGKESSIGGGTDSYYEYLLKSAILFGDSDCRKAWESSLKSINRWLADTLHGGLWYGHADMENGKITGTYSGALDAFFAGTLCLGGDLRDGRALQASNFRMWQLAGIEPESLNYATMKILDPVYELRPENFESCYYLYHYTHEEQYLRMARTMFESIQQYCRTDAGYAAVKDVRNMTLEDTMDSFFLAETLKYAYLIFAPENTLDFDGVIFNTEAHPLKRGKG